jgi:dehydrogenase/reductase SDR family protein 12
MAHPPAPARTALLTGAGGVFGFHIAAGLAAQGFATHLVVRDAAKGEALLRALCAAGAPRALLHAHACDLTSATSLAALAAALPPCLDLLVNNAAVTTPQRQQDAAGVELQWSTNVLAYQRLTRAVLPRLRAAAAAAAAAAGGSAAGPRVVLVASKYAGGLDLGDVEYAPAGGRAYSGDGAYRASKQANRMLGKAWAGREPGVTFVSCHPGVATSGVSLGLGFDLDRSPEAAVAGAATPLWLASAPAAELQSGAFYSDRRLKACAFSADAAAVEALWALVEGYH